VRLGIDDWNDGMVGRREIGVSSVDKRLRELEDELSSLKIGSREDMTGSAAGAFGLALQRIVWLQDILRILLLMRVD